MPQVDDDFGLRPVMTLRARLALVKALPAGQGISYGHAYVPDVDTVVGLVPAGYADGVPRNATNVGPLLVEGRRTTIAGRVCMDQFVVDLGPDSQARAGDVVTLFGGRPVSRPRRTGPTRSTPSATRSSPGSARGCPGSTSARGGDRA